MSIIEELRKSVNLPEKMVLSDGMSFSQEDPYDLRKSIAAEVLGHDVTRKENGSMPFFKEAYVKAKLENSGTSTEGMNMQKALHTTLSTFSAGTLPVLIPVYVDPEIVDLTRRATPLVELIPRVTNYGKTADYNQITAIATAQFLGEDAALTEQNDTYNRESLSIKYMYSVGRVTGPMFAASKQYLSSGGYVDALSLEVKNKTLAMKRLEEAAILLGDSQTDWTEPVNSTTMDATYSYDGLYQLITNANSNGFGGSSSYRTDNAGAAISIPALRTGIRTCRTAGGEPNLIVVDYATYDNIKALIQDQLRYVSTQTIAWGIVTLSFEGLPIIASRFLSTTAGTGSGVPADARSVFILDTNVIEMRVLQDVSYEELAKTNDSIKFMLKCYEVLICKAPQFNHIIIDIG
jgi:hypothetical protein